jgi:ADP-ribose pyrophosphatase
MGNSQEKPKVHPWTIVSEHKEYHTPVFDLYKRTSRHPDMGEGTFYVVDTPAWINVVAETEDGQVVLIDQFRHGMQAITTEIPGGMVDPGETPLESAKRELLEETGYSSDDWTQIGMVEANPAIMNNETYTFLARNCRKRHSVNPDPHEEIAVWAVTREKLFALVDDGIIRHALVVSALMHYQRWLSRDSS